MKRLAIGVCTGVFLLLLVSRQGHAAPLSQTCTVTNVSWYTGTDGQRLYISCVGGGFYAANLKNVGSSSCSSVASGAVDIDSIKMWQSLATSAKLSGKTITTWYNNSPDCGSAHILYSVDFSG